MRNLTIGTAVIAVLITPAKANTQLGPNQAVLAMALEIASFAASHCPGIRLVEGASSANVQSVGVTNEQTTGQEWKSAKLIGELYSKHAHAKNSSEFCERAWLMLGPHPSVTKHSLLEKANPAQANP
jgi:hypothetical protein